MHAVAVVVAVGVDAVSGDVAACVILVGFGGGWALGVVEAVAVGINAVGVLVGANTVAAAVAVQVVVVALGAVVVGGASEAVKVVVAVVAVVAGRECGRVVCALRQSVGGIPGQCSGRVAEYGGNHMAVAVVAADVGDVVEAPARYRAVGLPGDVGEDGQAVDAEALDMACCVIVVSDVASAGGGDGLVLAVVPAGQ